MDREESAVVAARARAPRFEGNSFFSFFFTVRI
jgi:hypothetical protein